MWYFSGQMELEGNDDLLVAYLYFSCLADTNCIAGVGTKEYCLYCGVGVEEDVEQGLFLLRLLLIQMDQNY